VTCTSNEGGDSKRERIKVVFVVTWKGLIPGIGWKARATVVLKSGTGKISASTKTVESLKVENTRLFQIPLVPINSLTLGVTVAPRLILLAIITGGKGI
jgi:hypothetical protein